MEAFEQVHRLIQKGLEQGAYPCAALAVGMLVQGVQPIFAHMAMGTLLSAERSPLGVALTEGQCISYALSRPAGAAVMVGMQRISDVENAVAYWDLPEKERDHSEVLASLGMFRTDAEGRCMYCNHCLPCPARIDIAAVNKYLDLVDALANRVPLWHMTCNLDPRAAVVAWETMSKG